MDEEFFFPQNVRTSYRLWLFGPRHLLRLAAAPVLAVVFGWLVHGLSLTLGVIFGVMVGAAYTALCCVPILESDETLLDVGLSLLRHRRQQARYCYEQEVIDREALVLVINHEE